MAKEKRCKLCGREVPHLGRHHLIPRTRHSNKKNKREFSRDEVHKQERICVACHDQIHALFTTKELEYEYNTLEAIAAHEEMAKFIAWIRTKPAGKTYRSKRQKR